MDELDRQLSELANHSPVQRLLDPFPEPVAIQLFLKRDDLIHPQVSGNKWRKLKYNLLEARRLGLSTLLTFGGAYSNHLYSTAAAGQVFGFQTIGIVRGEELANAPRNPTLQFCESCGMRLEFISRPAYREKENPAFLKELTAQFGPCYILPEGGTNELAIRGTSDIIPELLAQMNGKADYVCCPVGTGGTVAGLLKVAPTATYVIGFLALNAPDFKLAADLNPNQYYRLESAYSFGGYAKITPGLIRFIHLFEQKTGVLLEQVYTGKMLYGIYDLARQGYFPPQASVVAIHTGGLQGRSKQL